MIQNKDELLANLRLAKRLMEHGWTSDHAEGDPDCLACSVDDNRKFHDAVDDALIALDYAVDLIARGPGLLSEDQHSYMTCRQCGTLGALFRVETDGDDGWGARTAAPLYLQCVSCGETYGLALSMQPKVVKG